MRLADINMEIWLVSADFTMSNAQREHALAIERLVPEFVALRLNICSYMNVEKFWMIYFLLILPRLNQHDFERLSTPKASHVYSMLSYFQLILMNSMAKYNLLGQSVDIFWCLCSLLAYWSHLQILYLCEYCPYMVVGFSHYTLWNMLSVFFIVDVCDLENH